MGKEKHKEYDEIQKVIDKHIETLKTDCCSECSWTCESATKCKCPECEVKDATEMAIFALEMQKPKEPIDLDDGLGMHDRVLCCPSCKNPIANVWNKRDYKPLFCHCCGQRFKWNDDEK